MKKSTIHIHPKNQQITRSPGLQAKKLGEYRLELAQLCDSGSLYCALNSLKLEHYKNQAILQAIAEQTGEHVELKDISNYEIIWSNIIELLERELVNMPADSGQGKTLVFSQLTDGFAPLRVHSGETRAALDVILTKTRFRIRVLTKNSLVGTKPWIDYLAAHRDRFVVGVSIGTLDKRWARIVERFTPVPTERIEAVHRLQDSGIPTCGMLCPVFPHVLAGDHLEQLVEQIRPHEMEHVWVEPFSDGSHWRQVRNALRTGSTEHTLLSAKFDDQRGDLWSAYATELYLRIRAIAQRDGWLHKLWYLLYESDITPSDAGQFVGLEGVLLQSIPGPDGLSYNSAFAGIQRK